ncbi:MAG: hypothetical protein R3C28_14830 [Pirellulaceae bacterium]
MNVSDRLRQLRCDECQWRKTVGPDDMVDRLRTMGRLRRDAKPDWEYVLELFRLESQNMTCGECGQQGLLVEPVSDDFDDWGQPIKCEVCKAVIPPERIEIFPNSKRCAKCVDVSTEEREFCDYCGGLMKMAPSRGAGIVRYQMICSDCGR